MPIPYATFEDVQARIGADLLNDKVPYPTDFDPDAPNYDHVETLVEAWIDEASLEIDLSLRRAGYPAPCVTDGTSTVIPEAAEQLRSWCIALALDIGQIGQVGESSPTATAAARTRKQLSDLVRGAIRLAAPLRSAIAGTGVYPRTASRFDELGTVIAARRLAPEP